MKSKGVLICLALVIAFSCNIATKQSETESSDTADVIRYFPDIDSTSDLLLLVNCTANDFNDHSRTHSMLSLRDKLAEKGITLKTGFLFGKSEYTSYVRRLARISRLDSLVTVISDDSAAMLAQVLRTTRPIAVLLNKEGDCIEIGRMERPEFKQKIFSYYNHLGLTEMILPNSLIHMKANTDTTVIIKNGGPNPLFIYDIDSSCECSRVTADKTAVAPGKSTLLHIAHRRNGPAKTRSNILIYSNATDGIREIVINAH